MKLSSSEDNIEINEYNIQFTEDPETIISGQLLTQKKFSGHQRYYVYLMDKPLEKILIRYSNKLEYFNKYSYSESEYI